MSDNENVDQMLGELEVVLRGPAKEDSRGYPQRVTLAKLEVPVTGERGWTIYQYAVAEAMGGEFRIGTQGFTGDAAWEKEIT